MRLCGLKLRKGKSLKKMSISNKKCRKIGAKKSEEKMKKESLRGDKN